MNVFSIMTTKLMTVAPTASIDRAISLMEANDIHHLCVVDGNYLVGLVSDRDILIATGWMLAIERNGPGKTAVNGKGIKRVAQIMSKPAQVLEESNNLREAANMMLTHRIGAIPILSKQRLVGIVTDADLLGHLGDVAVDGTAAERFLQSAVKNLMTTPVITVNPDASLDEVVDNFKRFHIRHVPVATGKALRGIISDRDVRRALGWSAVCDMQADAQNKVSPFAVPEKAAEIMQSDVKTVTSRAKLGDALRLMRNLKIHSLPVVEGDALIGIVTQTDFVNAIAREQLI